MQKAGVIRLSHYSQCMPGCLITNPPEFPKWGCFESDAQWTVTPCDLCPWLTTVCVCVCEMMIMLSIQIDNPFCCCVLSIQVWNNMRHMFYMSGNEYNNQYQTAILVLIPFALKKLWKLTYQASTSSKIQASLYCAAPTSCFEPLSSFRCHGDFVWGKFRLLRARVFVPNKYFQGWSNEETIHMLKLKILKRVFVSAGAPSFETPCFTCSMHICLFPTYCICGLRILQPN